MEMARGCPGRGHTTKALICHGFNSESEKESLEGLSRTGMWLDLRSRKIYKSTNCMMDLKHLRLETIRPVRTVVQASSTRKWP